MVDLAISRQDEPRHRRRVARGTTRAHGAAELHAGHMTNATVTTALRDLLTRIHADPDDASGVLADLDLELGRLGLNDERVVVAGGDLDQITRTILLELGAEVGLLPPHAAIGAGAGVAATIVRIRQLARFVAEVSHAALVAPERVPVDGPVGTVVSSTVGFAAAAEPPDVEHLGLLTPAERRVVALVATGRSNPEIASLLVVSRRTVESQIAAAYRKLGVTSRVQLTLLALDAGLVA